MRGSRDPKAHESAITALEQVAKSGKGNLLSAAVDAARARASLGEISDAMERGFGGRHHAVTKVIGGVYENVYHDDPEYQAIQSRIADYTADKGRAPHVLVAKMGQDGHDRGAKVIATAFADMGFKVDLTDMFETPAEVTDRAIALGVDVVGVSSLAAGHKSLVPELIDRLKDKGRADIQVVVGGVIPEQDYAFLREKGVAEIFGPGSNVLDAANAVLARISGLKRNV
jgi:methylmalonyl-CoA mutase